MNKQEKEYLSVKILSPTEHLYEGKALSVSANNKVGHFDVLAGHTNFFSILTASGVEVNTGEKYLTFPIVHGLMKVHDNVVTLYVDINAS